MTTEASDFLRRRRSHPPKTLRGPAPSRAVSALSPATGSAAGFGASGAGWSTG